MTDTPMVVVLGAGQPFTGTDPSALVRTSGDRRVLDWILDAFETALSDPEIHFVGGYRMDDIVEEYPEIHFSRNEDWEESGTVTSLFTAPVTGDRPVYVCYADTIFESQAVEALAGDADVTVAIDRSWQSRYRSRSRESLERAEKVRLGDDGSSGVARSDERGATLSGNGSGARTDAGALVDAGTDLAVEEADGELTGLMRLSPAALQRAQALRDSRTIDRQADLPALLRALSATGRSVRAADIGDRWAELETADDLSRFVLDTKANTLRRLQSMVEHGRILDQETFTVGDWRTDPDRVCASLAAAFDGPVIVRSSTFAEDGFEESNAGRFESVLDVPVGDADTLADAIERVIDSYPDATADHQVLVQPMVEDVAASGVVMTRTIEGNGPYYVVNYDATTASTESVTDGTGEHLQTAIVRRDVVTDGLDLDTGSGVQYPSAVPLADVLAAVRELEELIGHESLDVEFAIDGDGAVYVLQARPMTLDPGERTVDDEQVIGAVETASREFRASQQASPFVLGDRTIYGVMPDWNPAEIIGRQPRRLAASLYRYLVTDEIWATQRAEYGYRDVRPQPLLKSFAGQPYIDVRADINSFIPASVPDELAERLVTYYLDRLEANPELHDKIEFDVVLTCLTFDYDHQIAPLLEAGFTREELEPLREGLTDITHEAVDRIERGTDFEAIERLGDRYEQLAATELPPLHATQYLLADCRRHGTLPFAHLARTAFVATALLRSLERTGVLDSDQRAAFQNSLHTVARQFEADAYRVSTGELDWERFVDRYGHLRPGTYDITSPAYREAPEEYLRPVVETATQPESRPEPTDCWDAETRAAVEAQLDDIGLAPDADRFLQFLADAIEGREHSKFVFSRNLSAALDRIATFGDRHGLDREALSHIPIGDYLELVTEHPPGDVEGWLRERVREGRERHATTRAVELPPLLFEERDFLAFERPAREPNFVTDATVRAEALELDEREDEPLDGRVVLIPQADPGYDWLFGHDIAGLVTMYGGTNSHMAVRAAEFGLPAAIGVGESRYNQLRRGEVLELDCDGRQLRVIQ